MASPPRDRDIQGYCSYAECDRPTKEGRTWCNSHAKQIQRRGRLSPIAEQLSPEERVIEAANRLAESSSEDDAAYVSNRKAVLSAAAQFAPLVQREAISAGMAQAKANGVRLGRPPKLTAEQIEMAQRLVPMVGVTRAAEILGVHRATLSHAMADEKRTISRRSTRGEAAAESSISRRAS